MRNRIREYVALCKLEWSAFYQFPTLEGIFALLLGIAFLFTSAITGRDPGISISPFPVWDGGEVYEYYLEYVMDITTSVLGIIFTLFAFVFVFIASLMIAFNFGKSLDDGFAQTCLSYPVSRKGYVATKLVMFLLVFLLLSFIAAISSIYIFIPGPKPITAMVLFFISYSLFTLLVTSCIVLIAILTKNAFSTIVGGTGIWMGFLLLGSLSEIPAVVLSILHPVRVIIDYLNGGTNAPLITEVYVGWIVSLLASIFLIIFSFAVFERDDISGG